MRIINKILKSFQDIYCMIGVHNWIIKPERFKATFKSRKRTIEISRHYRICSNCFKCQHSGAGIHRNKWFNEDEKETNRRPISRSLKLKKIQQKIK